MVDGMLTLNEYLVSAEKAINRWGHPDMLKSEDDIASVAHFMMDADSKFDGRGSRSGFRMSYAKFAIQNLVRKFKNQRVHYSLNHQYDEDGMEFHETLVSKNKMEDNFFDKELIEKIEKLPNIPKRNLDMIKDVYMFNMTCEEVGKKLDISPQAVHICIQKTIAKIRTMMKYD